MRTTLTLEPDVAAEIRRLRSEKGASLKAVVNGLLREGLRSRRERIAEAEEGPYTRVLKAGRPLISIDDVAEALAIAEGDDYR